MKMKIDYLEAYVDHLESDNIKASIISKRSGYSKAGKLNEMVAEQDHSVLSIDQSNRNPSSHEYQSIIGKVKMITEFIENYRKDEIAMEREEEFRQKLKNRYLDELLNTIFYRLEKESNNIREKEH